MIKKSASGSEIPYCLYRATDGRKKLSCVVDANGAETFQTNYVTVVRAAMSSLHKVKKDRKKKKAAGKVEGTTTV